MQDRLRSLADVGAKVRSVRKSSKLSTVQIASLAGRSRDVLNRLERGEDVSLSSLMAFLTAMGHALEIVPAGRPTLAEMQRRFTQHGDDDQNPAGS